LRGLLWIYLLGLTHEIDTIARRRVPLAFPAEWEHRELTGRDYGIDMMIEIFFKWGSNWQKFTVAN